MSGNKTEVIKPIRKMFLRARIRNLSLQTKENSVTFETKEFGDTEHRWAYYQLSLMGTLEKAFDEEFEVELTIHRMARIVGGDHKETKDIIMKAEIVKKGKP